MRIKILKNVRKFLIPIGLYPNNGETYNLRCVLRYSIQGILLGGLGFLGLFGHFYVVSKNNLRTEQLAVFSFTIELAIYIMFCTILLVIGNRIIDLLGQLSYHKFGEPPNVRKIWEKHEKITIWIFYVIKIFIIFYCVYCYHTNSFCEAKIPLNDDRFICGSSFPAWFPIDFPQKELLMVIMDFFFLATYYPACSTCVMFIMSFTELLILRVRHLRKFINAINFSDQQYDRIRNELRFCIAYHIEIKSLVDKMNCSVGYMLFNHYVLITTNLALLEYQLIFYRNSFYLMHLLGWFAFEIMICTCGQMLEDEGNKLIWDLYNTTWYEMHPNLRTDFKIFLGKVKQPLPLSIGSLLRMNMQYLLKIFQGSYSFLMFLRNLSTNDSMRSI